MLNSWNVMLQNFDIYTTNNILLGLLGLVLLYFYMMKKEDLYSKIFFYYFVIFIVILFVPVTNRVLSEFIDARSMIRVFWLIPVFILLPYVIVRIQDGIKKDREKMIFLCVVVVFVGLNAGITTAYSRGEVHGVYYNVPKSVINIVNVIKEDASAHANEEPMVLFPVSMIPFVRQYDSTIILPFGGPVGRIPQPINEKNDNISELINIYLSSKRMDDSRLVELMKKEKIDYFVIYAMDVEHFEYEFDMLNEVAIVDGYILYKINSAGTN